MSLTGIANPRPPILKMGLHSFPKLNDRGDPIKPHPNLRRVRVTDKRTKKLIAYFDISNEDSRPMTPARVCERLLMTAKQKRRTIVAEIVHLVLAKSGHRYYEVSDPCINGNCIVIEGHSGQDVFIKDNVTYIFGKDDFHYRLVEDPKYRQPINKVQPFWDAANIL